MLKLRDMFKLDEPVRTRGMDGKSYMIFHPMKPGIINVPAEEFEKAAGLFITPARWRAQETILCKIQSLSERIHAENAIALEEGRKFRHVMRCWEQDLRNLYERQEILPEMRWKFKEHQLSMWIPCFRSARSKVVVIGNLKGGNKWASKICKS